MQVSLADHRYRRLDRIEDGEKMKNLISEKWLSFVKEI